jgi:hypothetical protein
MTEDTVPIVRGKPFQSGDDPRRNMNGKPKGARHFTTLFKEAVTKIAEGEAESDDILIVKKVIAKAKEGDLKAVDMILDRTDGKAEQIINLDADVTVNDGLTDEQKEALLNLLK